MKWMRQNHKFSDMLTIDFFWIYEHHTPLRYCADMMFSGHTFVVTLFALGTYEMIRAFRLENFGDAYANKAWLKMSALSIFASLIVAEQFVEIYYVERSHFHYSMDVFMAIVLTFLIYTNGVISVFAKRWATWGFLALVREEWIKKDKSIIRGALNVFRGNGQGQGQGQGDIEDKGPDNKDVWKQTEGELSTDPMKDNWALWNSRGDIFIPPCCIPFCCFSGREHVYSDEGIMDIIKEFAPKKEAAPLRQYLSETMMLNDGVMWSDALAVASDVEKYAGDLS